MPEYTTRDVELPAHHTLLTRVSWIPRELCISIVMGRNDKNKFHGVFFFLYRNYRPTFFS